MKIQTRCAVAIIAQFFVAAACQGAKPARTTETVLVEWQKATEKIEILDVRFARLTVDPQFGTETCDRGRFYWESSGPSCYQLDGKHQLIWNDGITILDSVKQTYFTRSSTDVAQARQRLPQLERLAWFERCLHWGEMVVLAQTAYSVLDLLPLCTEVDAVTVSKRYQLDWETNEQGIVMTAVPKVNSDANWIRQFDVILAPDNLTVLAHRIVDPLGREVVHVFEPATFNTVPDDRDELLKPDLKEYVEELSKSFVTGASVR